MLSWQTVYIYRIFGWNYLKLCSVLWQMCCSLTNVKRRVWNPWIQLQRYRQTIKSYLFSNKLYFNKVLIKDLVIEKSSILKIIKISERERGKSNFFYVTSKDALFLFLHSCDSTLNFSSRCLWKRVNGSRFSIQDGFAKSQKPNSIAGRYCTYRTKESRRKMPVEWRQTSAGRKALSRPWNPGLSMKRSRFDNKYVARKRPLCIALEIDPDVVQEESIREEMKNENRWTSNSYLECDINSA